MRNLLVLLDQVQALGDDGVIFVFVLTDLHEDFDHILHTMANGALVKDSTEAFEDGGVRFWGVLGKESPDFTHKPNSNFDGVVRRTFEEENEDLESNDFVRDSLIDEMPNKRCGGMADNLREMVNAVHMSREDQ